MNKLKQQSINEILSHLNQRAISSLRPKGKPSEQPKAAPVAAAVIEVKKPANDFSPEDSKTLQDFYGSLKG